jgi:ABC-type nitrate/sulfonate/bicarbonate transport system substrate-binding protein
VDLDRSGIKTPIIEGSHPKQYEALKRGVGDGAMLGAPWWIYAIRDGYKNMGSGSEYGEDLPHLVIYAAAEKIVRQPDQTRGFVTAMVKSMEYCRKNVPATLETVMRYSGQWGVDNVEIARMVYDVFVPNWSAEIDIAAAARLLEHASHKLGKPTPPLESFVDLSFLREAQREVG